MKFPQNRNNAFLPLVVMFHLIVEMYPSAWPSFDTEDLLKSSIPTLFELEDTDISFNREIEHLPERFGNISDGYSNGPPLKRHAPVLHPNPARMEGTWDNTTYFIARGWWEIPPLAFYRKVGLQR